MPPLKLKRVVGKPNYGGCKPVWVIADDGKEYLLKFRQDEFEKDISNFNEVLGYGLDKALELNLSPQQIRLIEISEEDLPLFQTKLIDYESIEFAKKSIGLNIAIEKIPFVQKVDFVDIAVTCKKIANLDNIILNTDRTEWNSNILYNTDISKYCVIDYGMALVDHRIYNALKNGEDISQCLMLLKECDATKSGFYLLKNQSKIGFGKSFQECYDIVSEIIQACPSDWEPMAYASEITDLIACRIVNKLLFKNGPCECGLLI